MRRMVLTALVLAVLPGAASAQFQVGGGFAIPTGDAGDVLNTGLHAQASFNLGLPLLPDLRLDGIYQTYDAEVGDGSTDVLGGSVNLLLDLPLVVIKPYVLAGVGYYDVSQEAEVGGVDVEASSSDFGFTGGVGLRVALGRLGVFGEARVLSILGEDDNFTNIPLVVGLTF
jgi:hypothetical protein